MACNTPASSGATAVYFTPMTDCETIPENPTWTRLRITSGVPTINRDVLSSAELTGSAEVESVRLGNVNVQSEISFDLSSSTFDDLFEGAMQSSWQSGASTSGLTVQVVADGKQFIVKGADVSADVKVGDEINFDSLTDGNAGVFLVSKVDFSTDTTITVIAADGALTDEADASTSLKVSDSMTIGTTRKYFAMLTVYNDLTGGPYYELTKGVEMTNFSLNGSVNAFVTGSFTGIGRTFEGTFTKPDGTLDSGTKDAPFTGIDTCVFSGGERVALGTSVDVSLDRGASAAFVLCSKFVSHVSYDKATVTMNIGSFFFSDALDTKFLDETDVDVAMRMELGGKVFSVSIPQARITEASKTVDTGDIQQTFNVQGFGIGQSLVLRRLEK